MHMNKPEGSCFLTALLHEIQITSVLICHHFRAKEENRILHTKCFLGIAV